MKAISSTLLGLALAGLVVAAVAHADDADTLTIGDKRFRLDGIDAPEIDQFCLDAEGTSYACGRTAWEALHRFAAGRPIVCDDLRADASVARSHSSNDVELSRACRPE